MAKIVDIGGSPFARTSNVLGNLHDDLRKYVCLRDDAAVAVPLWVLHTYCVEASFISPRLAITSPVKRCGKSTLIDWLSTVVWRPMTSVNISPAAVFRTVEAKRPTLLIDEADRFLAKNNELCGVLNSGHKANGVVHRWDALLKVLRDFSTYSACALSLIGKLPGTLADRSIHARLRRRLPDEPIHSLRLDQGNPLADQCYKWAEDNINLLSREPDMPGELTNRVADNWRPLLAIADQVGGDWPAMARAVAVSMTNDLDEDDSPLVQLLAEIREIFKDRPWMGSKKLVAELAAREMLMSEKSLALKLASFDIAPKQERRGKSIERGYRAEWFADAWARYLPTVTDVTDVTD
jgi:hypothetical protein